MSVVGRVVIATDVVRGKPVILGTRITIELLLRKLSEGSTDPDLLDAYPNLIADDIRAALAYAAAVVSHDEIVLTAPSGPEGS